MTFLPKRGAADAGGARPAVLGLHRAGRAARSASPAASRWCARTSCSLFRALSRHLETGDAGGTDAHHQRQPARALCRRAEGGRRAADQRLARHARPGQVQGDHPLGRSRQGAWTASAAAKAAGLAVKINAVALKGVNERRDRRHDRMVRMARGMDLTLIETMPLGEIERRPHRPVSAAVAGAGAAARAAGRWRTSPTGPAARRAMCEVAETGGRLGFITPLTHNFCESCNRVRLTCTGTLYMCLGQEDAADLRAPLRARREGNELFDAPSTRRSRASRRATTSSSTGDEQAGGRPPYERHRRLISSAIHRNRNTCSKVARSARSGRQR